MEVTKMLRKILSFVLVLALGFLLTGAAMAVIEPSGDQTGVTDTATIEYALNAAAPGDVVELDAGDFYLYRTVEVTNFSGTFKGRGRTATTIHNAPNVLFQKIETPHRPLDFGVELAPLFYFVQSTVSELIVSDMRLEVVGMTEDLWVHGPNHSTGYRNFDFFEVENLGPSLSTRFERIDFVGDRKDEYGLGFWNGGVSYPGWDVNAATAIGIYDHTAYSDLPRSSGGEYTVSDCTFVNGMFFTYFTGLKDATVTVEEDTLEYLMISASFLRNLSGTRVMVENLDTYNSSLSVVWQDPFLNLEPSTYVITHNNIRMLEENVGWAGIEMYDYTGQDVADVLISHNTIHSPFQSWAPILGYGVDGVVVKNNYITGNWIWGINPYAGSDGWTITNNLFEGMNSMFGAVSIEESDNCTIKNNTFINVSGLCAVWVSGQGNTVGGYFDDAGNWVAAPNDYSQSGLPGWKLPSDPNTRHSRAGCVLLAGLSGAFNRSSVKNYVREDETLFPDGTGVCDQVLGIQGNTGLSRDGTIQYTAGRCRSMGILKDLNADKKLMRELARAQQVRDEKLDETHGKPAQ